MDKFDITIIGAGVVGLAIGAELSRKWKNILIVEKNDGCGRETSSRNSEVIHAGIYYPAGFLKSTLCVSGNRLLYEFCASRGISHKRTGKIIVATCRQECDILESIKARADLNGVQGLTLLGERQVKSLEPDVHAVAALFSPDTGIIDSHGLMRAFNVSVQENGATLALHSEITAIRPVSNGRAGYELEINNGEYVCNSGIVINSAGLYADKIAALAGMDLDAHDCRLKYCKGDYFSASPCPKLKHLVYPVPVANNEGLGIHATVDLNGRVRFGPDSRYLDAVNPDKASEYAVDEGSRGAFFQAISRYLPGIREEHLTPDMSGIRPKLQGPDESYRDFLIREEKDAGLTGFINLIGIESPGLTSCMAIAQYVLSLCDANL